MYNLLETMLPTCFLSMMHYDGAFIAGAEKNDLSRLDYASPPAEEAAAAEGGEREGVESVNEPTSGGYVAIYRGGGYQARVSAVGSPLLGCLVR
jgi:hypothetical protein